MPTPSQELVAAFHAQDAGAIQALLERMADQVVDLMAAANRSGLQDLWRELGVALDEARHLELSAELRDLRGFLDALVHLVRAARDRTDDLEAARRLRRRDFRPAILTAIRNEGSLRHEVLVQLLGLSRPALERTLRALADAKTLVASVEDDAVCYTLTPLGHVVARGLEARAMAGEEVAKLPVPCEGPGEPSAPAAPEQASTPDAVPLGHGIVIREEQEAPAGQGRGPSQAEKEHSKTRVAVLHGGISSERELSLEMGEAVAEALREAAFLVEPIDVREAALSDLRPNRVDVAFVALRGTFGEDGGIQAVLEAFGVPYTGSGVEASRAAMDKVAAKKRFRAAGVPTPAFLEVEAEWAMPLKLRAAGLLGFPAVLKPTREGSGFGVVLARSEAELGDALGRPFEFDTRALVEPFIEGRELAVTILDGRPLPTVELLYDGPILTHELRATEGAVRRVVEPDLSPEVTETVRTAALAAHRALGCRGCACVDIRLGAHGMPYVLEVNTVPPLTRDSVVAAAAAAAGIGFTELCQRYVELAQAASPALKAS